MAEAFQPTNHLLLSQHVCNQKAIPLSFPRTFILQGHDYRPIPYPWCLAKHSLLLKVNFDACDYTGYISQHLQHQLNFTIIMITRDQVYRAGTHFYNEQLKKYPFGFLELEFDIYQDLRLSNLAEFLYTTEFRVAYCDFKHYERLVSFKVLIIPFKRHVLLTMLLLAATLSLILSPTKLNPSQPYVRFSTVQKVCKVMRKFLFNLLNLLRIGLNQDPNHSSFVLFIFSCTIIVFSSYYTNYLTTSIIEPIRSPVFENIHEIVHAGYTFLYPSAIPNVSERASGDIEAKNIEFSKGMKEMFGLTEDQSKLVSPISSSVSAEVLFGHIGNPKKKSAFIFKTYEYTKQCAVNNMKSHVPKYSCTLCKQVLHKYYVFGYVVTPFAEQKLFLLKLFKSSGLTNFWLQRQYFSCVIRTSKALKQPETLYITISNLHAFLSLICIMYFVEILVAIEEASRNALSRHLTAAAVSLLLINKINYYALGMRN